MRILRNIIELYCVLDIFHYFDRRK